MIENNSSIQTDGIIDTKEYCTFCGVYTNTVGALRNEKTNISNAEKNLHDAVCCSLCHQLGCADWIEGKNEVIYAPEFSQPEINALVIASWLAADTGGPLSEIANEIIDDLQARSVFVRSVIRRWIREEDIRLQEPFNFTADIVGQAKQQLESNSELTSEKLLGGLRLLPSKPLFLHEIEYWNSYYGAIFPSWKWGEIAPELRHDLTRTA